MPSIERTLDKRWRARYRDLSGRSRSRTFDRRIDATRLLELSAAGLPGAVRTHELRHTCASLLIHLGAHPRAIQHHSATATSA